MVQLEIVDMAKAKTVKQASPEIVSTSSVPVPRPRLHKLRVSNFRSVGNVPVEIELDDIVVLVGPNNSGKSSILRAYQIVMEHGSNEGKMTLDDFPDGKINPQALPTIELETIVYDKAAPGEKWIETNPVTGEMLIKEKWTWAAVGAPKKVGWEVAAGKWHDSEGPWGTPNVAQKNRPKPHYIKALHSLEQQTEQVVSVLKEAIKTRVKDASKKAVVSTGEVEELSHYDKLLVSIKEIQKIIAADATTAVEDVCIELGKVINEVFPGYSVSFDARPEDDIEKTISLFKADPLLRMGPQNGFQTTLDRQGSGACRTMLWAALRILADRASKEDASERPHLLLIDEPEMCLHPDAIREACRVLYDLPQNKNWQVMITTHSPIFVDFSRDNTSIARVERAQNGSVQGTTIYRPKAAQLDNNDKIELKLLNLCDPYMAEFFFGGKTIVVEGDTEYTAFKYVISQNPDIYKGIHLVRARGKASIVSLCKILNQFDKQYAVLHDADSETVPSKKNPGKTRANSAWTENKKILAVTEEGRKSGKIRLLASVPNFESAYFGEEADGEKPYNALCTLKENPKALEHIKLLLDALIDTEKSVPTNALAWESIEQLSAEVLKVLPAAVPYGSSGAA
jgi:putative ATP-dependent endonuclease of the OLD family